MAIFDFLRPKTKKLAEPSKIEMQTDAVGSSGTSIFAGYFDEEYLHEIRGIRGADIFDKMRRSEPFIKMVLGAIKNPIKRAEWSIDAASDDALDVEIADFVKFLVFEDMGHGIENGFAQFLTNALSMVDFGYSAFEIVDKVENGYNGIGQIAFRSQRTIEEWKLDPLTGAIEAIRQRVDGDLRRDVLISGKFLLVNSLDKEGDNYEGISILRAAYGAWKRKLNLKKIQAIGSEKFAIPTAIGTVPKGLENSPEYTRFKTIIAQYSSHESSYIIKPEGWEIEFNESPFDGSKVQPLVDAEDNEMAVAALANFLLLGSKNGSGSYALGTDLSDFFLNGIEHIAEIITENFNRGIIKRYVDLNYGPQEVYPKLRCSGIADKAGEEFARIVTMFVEKKVIIPDDVLEDSMRKKFKLPPRSEEGQRDISPAPAPFEGGGAPSFSEKKSIKFAAGKKNPGKLIAKESETIRALMQEKLTKISNDMIDRIMRNYKNATPATRVNAINGIEPRYTNEYKAALKDALLETVTQAGTDVQAELPPPRGFKFAEKVGGKTLKLLNKQAGLLFVTQPADISKLILFQFLSSEDSTDSAARIEQDLREAAGKYIAGSSVQTASGNVVATLVNKARDEYLTHEDIAPKIESFTFVNEDPVSAVCQELNGRTFSPDDAKSSEFKPPLHHNCKSWLAFNMVGANNPEITDIVPSKSAQKSITLNDLS